MVLHRLRRHSVSCKYAFKGLGYAVKTQPNFRTHLALTLIAFLLGILFEISRIEWLVLVLTVSAVLTAEMLNTSVELVTDALKEHKKTEKDDFYIMAAKDIGAGAVLVTAAAAVIVGFIIFAPKFSASLFLGY